ncbi:MAG: valine--tRNA ligase, partial [Gammaproteobacteria bacterium]|nr:valine--tRNA ligase [Gammaproteobacteria bacterium]
QTDHERFVKYQEMLLPLIKASELKWLTVDQDPPVAAMHLVGDMQVMVPMEGLIDKDTELTRLDKEISKLRQDKERAEKKIGNPDFIAKAPAEVVEKEKTKLQELSASLEQLQNQYRKVSSLSH